MPTTIFINTIPEPNLREKVSQAITEEIGDRSGEWTADIHEDQSSVSWNIHIKGPDGFNWKREFFGVVEQDSRAEFVRRTVREALPKKEP